VLYEKGMDFQVIDVDMYNKPEDIAVMNPYNRLPVLVERDLILYDSNIINELHRRALPASPADARRSGDARARPADAVQYGSRAVLGRSRRWNPARRNRPTAPRRTSPTA
jgi:glutathione S-transferase